MTHNSPEEEIELEIEGMTCDSCAVHVSKALRNVKGILQVDVPGWTSNRAIVLTVGNVKEGDLITAVEKAGYQATVRKKTINETQIYNDTIFDYDLVVIGTGGAGVAAAIRGAELGQNVGIIEAGTIGGTCVNIGCVPSKTLIRAAEIYHKAGHNPFNGVHTKSENINWKTMINQKDELIKELRQNKYLDVLASYGDSITLIRSTARIKPEGIVVLDNGKSVSARKIVVATGASPKMLSLADNIESLTSTSAMELKDQPESLLIIGGRAIALELGQMFARFGTKVTILQRSERILPEHEPELSNALATYLREEGLVIHTNVRLIEFKKKKGRKVVIAEINGHQQEFVAQAILMAVGKTPNMKNLGLETVGVDVNENGFIKVNEYLQTSNPQIYAAGDVTTHPKFVYVAAAAGGLAAKNALNGNQKKFDLSVLPSVVFTDPQVAMVGLTEAKAKKQGYDVKTTTLPLSYVPRAITARDKRGMIKLVADASSNQLLGAHVLAPEGGEIIQSATLIVKFSKSYGATIEDLVGTFFPYLVHVEAIKLAAQTFDKDVSKLSCCAG